MKIKSAIAIFFVLLVSCQEKVENYEQKIISEDAATRESRANAIMEEVTLRTAEGLNVVLWATDSLAPDPIAMSIDDLGNVYLTRTNRQKNSEFDIRGHRDWMIASISLQSVEDRRAFLRKTFAPEKSKENEWLKDLNNDGSHDWRDLAVEQDEVWMLQDTDNDGLADRSTRILRDFNDEISDVAGALLVRDKDMFVGIGPDMWRITDRNNDGLYDTKESISHGYAVHIGFGGHGMSGAIEGPDGKIYWGIGDIGANITTKDGRNLEYPNQGVLVRSNPDGSDFEVFAAGLRNTHEFVFDEYGNIIGADNDGDHPGEGERLVHIVEGSDAGWRSNWQYGKYTDPKNNTYKVWMDEKLYLPRWEGQAAYIIPPIMNYHNGPTGMAYNPGTALGSEWKNKFFLVEFTGNASRSPIWAFSLQPQGASFILDKEEKILEGILPTGIRFGPDGALYAADWINGWNTKNYGRVWKIDMPGTDLREERQRTKELMALDYDEAGDDLLFELLFYPDMRIRQKAQFELVTRGDAGRLQQAIEQRSNQLARIHGIWGIGQLAASGKVSGEPLARLLNDSDAEIIAQAAKVIGDVRYDGTGEKLAELLEHPSARVNFYAAQAIGRTGYSEAINGLLGLIERNNDADVYIRHAAVLALSRLDAADQMIALSGDNSRAKRIAAVLVLRRLQHSGVSRFLEDTDEYIAAEAARAINDDWSIEEALPDLAAMLDRESLASEVILRRSLNAASRLGGKEQADRLIRFLKRENVSPELRVEAIGILTTWGHPSVLDRVDGRFRGDFKRDSAYIQEAMAPLLAELLRADSSAIQIATAGLIGHFRIKDHVARQKELAEGSSDPNVRAAMITSLHEVRYEGMPEILLKGMNDGDPLVRSASLALINDVEMDRATFEQISSTVLRKGTIEEQQELLSVIRDMPAEESTPLLSRITDDWIAGKLSKGVSLELFEAVDSTRSEELIAKLKPYRKTGNTTEDFMDVLYGGNRRAGQQIYWNNATAQCTRCHAWNEDPDAVGPSLRGIASRISREEILRSLIEPGARIAPGYGSVMLKLRDGTDISGTLLEENDAFILLRTSEAEPLKIENERIAERRNSPSGMPPMGLILSKREIRDLVEYLSTLRE